MKKAIFKNNKVLKLIKEKEEISKIITELNKKWMKEDQEAKKLLMRMDRIKDKINPIVADEIKKLKIIEEFDVVTTAKYEKDDIVVEIVNQVEMFKEQLRNKDVNKKK